MNTQVSTWTNGRLALRYTSWFWFIVALAGQWLFVTYILIAYAVPLIDQDYAQINELGVITGYIAGDTFNNASLFAHVLLATVVSTFGLLQLVPMIRRHWPVFHRWNGRMFILVGMVGALTGLYLTWGRGSRLSDSGAMSVTLNGILILMAGTIAWYHAKQHQFVEHSRWAIRTLILVNGVWFFRLGLSSWFLINQGPLGNNSTLNGPMDLVIGFGSYLIPLAIAEVYFLSQRRTDAISQWVAAITLVLTTLWIGFGVFAAYMIMWQPHM